MLNFLLACTTLAPLTLHVSDRGNDTSSGSARRPFKTLDRIQRELLTVRARGDLRPVEVRLKGRFQLEKTLVLGPEFSHTTLRGPAVITGARTISGFKATSLNGLTVWAAAAPTDQAFRQLWVEGDRRPRARLPKQGFYRLTGLTQGAEAGPWNEGQSEAKFDPNELKPFQNLQDIDFVAHHYWIQSRMRIRSLDPATQTVTFDRKSVFRLTDDYTGAAAPYRLENVIEALTEPGEWVYDRSGRRILYAPRPNERLSSFQASFSSVPVLLRLEKAREVRVEDMTFEGTEWDPDPASAGDPQAAISTPGAVIVSECARVRFVKCRVRNVGTYGFEVLGGQENSFESCDLTDLGGGGIKIGHGSARTQVKDCSIVGGGRIFAPAVGVWIGNSSGNLISHNLIRDLFYTGVSVGWTWGYGPSDAVGNIIEYNDISDLGQGELSDMGGIYTLGVSPGTVLHHNRIRNVEARGYGGWGIYLDEGSTGILVENNLVQNTKTGGFHQHYGRENLIQNNVFMNARTEGQLIRSRAEDHQSFTIQRNVVVFQNAELLASNWSGSNFKIDGNLYWRTDGKPISFAGKSLDEWRNQGNDLSSRIEDPKIKIDDRGVRFDKGSPAEALGILPIDLAGVGPRRRAGGSR